MLFGHKVTLHRFNLGAHTIARGAQIGAGGLSPAWPLLTLTTALVYGHWSPYLIHTSWTFAMSSSSFQCKSYRHVTPLIR